MSDDPPSIDESNELDEPEIQWNSDESAQIRRVEAVLFYANTPLSSRKIAALAGLEDGTRARTLVALLNEKYDAEERAFHVKRVAGGYQLWTRPQFAKWIRRLEHVPGPTRLSGPAMETLAVVAYRQPITKADVEAIRGVSSGEMLRQLLDHGLIRIAGRSEDLGRPYLYATTREFLETFGLNSLDELPRKNRIGGAGLPSWSVSQTNVNSPGVTVDSNIRPGNSAETESWRRGRAVDPETP